jgi:hypothetical protein
MEKSLVFVSWSGDRAKLVAKALCEWLGTVIQSVDAWCSDATEAGKNWNTEITGRLSKAKVGIIVVTPENKDKPWLLFEAGAIAKQLPDQSDEARAIPFLFDVDTKDLTPPLSLLQYVQADKPGILRLVRSISHAVGGQVSDGQAETLVNAMYASLEAMPLTLGSLLRLADPFSRVAAHHDLLDTRVVSIDTAWW